MEKKIRWRSLDHRPIGITIISVLIMVVLVWSIIALFTANSLYEETYTPDFGLLVTLIIVGIALPSLFVAYGLLKGKGWSWSVTIGLSIVLIIILSIAFFITVNEVSEYLAYQIYSPDDLTTVFVSFIPCIIFYGFIIYYMRRSTVKGYYGKA
jgi:hypothetical protein